MHTLHLAPLALLLAATLTGCSKEQSSGPQPGDGIELRLMQAEATPAAPATLVYRCTPANGEPFELVTRYQDERLGVQLPERFGLPYQELPQVISASGARFANDQLQVWSKGNTAQLEVAGEDLGECVEDRPASLREVN